MASLGERIYRIAPIWAQHLLVTSYGLAWNRLRFGGDFERIAAGYLQRESFSSEQWQAYVETELRRVLTLAFDRVPFYRRHWQGIVTRDQLTRFTVSDMESLPPTEKRALRDHPHDFLLGGKLNKQHRIHHTSGSTGSPIATFWLPDERRHSMAVREMRSCRFAGVSYEMPRATFSGRIVEPDPNSKGPYYRFNLVERQVYFSAFHLSPASAAQYVEALWRHKIVWLTGYSNSIYQLAQMALDLNIRTPALKAVITTSEKLTDGMRSIIETAFRTRVYEEYGTVENVFYVCENEHGQKLVNPDYGLLEIVDDNFAHVPTGMYGEVLATGLQRASQPLIRYRVGDIAAFSAEITQCGRAMPVLKEVEGRVEDTVYAPDGRRMVRFHGIFTDQPHVREGQIVQERLDLIRVRIVPKAGFSAEDEADVVRRIQQRLTEDVQVRVEVVEQIERTARGKFKAVVSRLSREELQQVANSSTKDPA